jgi:WD40 repeat protein
LVVLEVLTGPSFGSTPYAVLSGIGDIDAAPVLFDRTSSPLLLVGGSDGTLRVYDALARVAGAGSELQLLQTIAGSDGAVRGIAVSRPIDDGLGGSSRWVVWTTTSLTQGVRIDQTGALVAGSSWSVPVSGPSAPLVLNDVLTPGDVLAYVGTTGGTLVELDAASGLTSRSWPLASAATVGDPTFDYGDGTAQGVVAGTTSGAIYWVPISAP